MGNLIIISLINFEFTKDHILPNKIFFNYRKPSSENLRPHDLWEPYTKNASFLQIGNNSDPSVTLQTLYYTERMNFWKQNLT